MIESVCERERKRKRKRERERERESRPIVGDCVIFTYCASLLQIRLFGPFGSGMVAQSVERPSKGHGITLLMRRGFEPRPSHKMVG